MADLKADGRRGGFLGVIFDWDGVLLDSLGASFSVYNKIFREIGTRRLTKEEFLELQSPNWYEFYSKIGLPTSLWERVDKEWLRLYDGESPKLYPDARNCLADLKGAGFRLALVSNGSEVRVRREIESFGLNSSFEVVLCGRKKEELKPSPVMLQRAMAAIGLEPRNVVYVGDASADVRASKNAGVESFALAREPILEKRLRAEEPGRVFGGLDVMTDFLVSILE